MNIQSSYKRVITSLFNRATGRRPKSLDEVSAEFLIRKAFFERIGKASGCLSSAKFIHVAGTKGKGSTCEYIAAALRGDGHSVGVFTSPHMHTTCERIKIGRQLISKEDFVEIGNWALQESASESWVNFFDVLLTMSLRYFGINHVEYVVLETGIGGRFDSTNFIEEPAVCIVTSVSLDHQNMLGETVRDIAWHKAGIVKKGAEVFTPSTLHPDAMEVLQAECVLKQARLHVVDIACVNAEVECTGHAGIMLENKLLAAAVCRHLELPCAGMKNFYWPCRLEKFEFVSSTCTLPVVLDGAHNDDSVRKFMDHLSSLAQEVWVVFGTGKDKNAAPMLASVAEKADRVILVQAKHYRAMDIHDLAAVLPEQYRHKLIHIPDRQTIDERLQYAAAEACERQSHGQASNVVLAVCGSLFAAAEAREALYRLQPSLFASDDWVADCDPEIVMESKKSG